MPVNKKIKIATSTEKMTVERLRRHLFDGTQVPFWNHIPKSVTIGLEIEYFIARVQGDEFTLANKSEYFEVLEHLKQDSGYKDFKLFDQPGRVSRDTDLGFIAIKPDFAWHILEISLPPRKTLPDLRALLDTVFAEIDSALEKTGLQRLHISCLPDAPNKLELVQLDRLNMFSNSVNQLTDGNPFIDPLFPAYVTATHVHLNAFNEREIRLLPALFEIETHTLNLYNRATNFAGIPSSNVRNQFICHTMGASYKLKGIPEYVPHNLLEYVKIMNDSSHAFPNDRFFPVRDVTYIRPSKFGTFEFRSACSTKNPEELLEIAAWRKIQLIGAKIATDVKINCSTALTQALEIVSKSERCHSMIFERISEKIRSIFFKNGNFP